MDEKLKDDGNCETQKDDDGHLVPNENSEGFKNMDEEKSPLQSLGQGHPRTAYVPGRGLQRYTDAMKLLIPIRLTQGNRNIAAADGAGFFSTISYSWIAKLSKKAYKTGININELPKMSQYDSCDYNADRIELLWKNELAEKGPEKSSFAWVAWRFCRTRVLVAMAAFILSLVLGFLSATVIMQNLLVYVESKEADFSEGLYWALMLILAELGRTILYAWQIGMNIRTGVRLKAACMTMVYRKVIRVNNLGSKSIGEVINVCSNDTQRFGELILHGSTIVSAPITTIWGIYYLWKFMSPVAMTGVIVLILFYPAQLMVSRLAGHYQNKARQSSDKRIRLTNEILDCMKLIKMYAWEKRFRKDLLDLRKKEEDLLLKTTYCQSFSVALAPAVPITSVIVSCLAHISAGNNLTAAQVFPYVSLLDSRFRISLNIFQYGIESIVAAGISFDRVKSILLLEDGNCQISKPIIKSQAIAIMHGTFSRNIWSDQEHGKSHSKNVKRNNGPPRPAGKGETEKLNKPQGGSEYVDVLFGISLEILKGQLIGICGQVGSGKSSLILAALGQLRISEGQVLRDGSCAYVSQQAWITNNTLRENILFGERYDQSLYEKVIYASNLNPDIDMMPAGDLTEIGEKGINLSGGQKQRVALARALYANRDIYFLDDPLSAVDSLVGSFIFDNLILGALKGKTVIFVTHQIQYLMRCDKIYMMRDGRIIEHGDHNELIKLDNQYASMVAAVSADNENKMQNPDDDHHSKDYSQSVERIPLHDEARSVQTASTNFPKKEKQVEKSDTPGASLMVDEKLQRGTVKANTYHTYILAIGGYLSCFLVILSFLLSVGMSAFSSWWLALWINAGGGNKTIVGNNGTVVSDNIIDNPDFEYYRRIYAGSIGVLLLTSVLRATVFTKACFRASTQMHNALFEKIIASPMRYFETTPIGRIQHYFSRDMDEVDNRLPYALTCVLQGAFTLAFAVLVICIVFPWFVLPMCFLAFIYYYITKVSQVAIRDLTRMSNISRVPVLSLLMTTVEGISTIHAFGVENDFKAKFARVFDENGKCAFMWQACIRWLAIRVDLLAVVITAITAFLVVGLHAQVPAALAGLAISYSFHIAGVFQYTIRMVSEAEVRFISVERMYHNIKTLEIEGGEKQVSLKPPSTWPVAPKINFKNVSLAYRAGTPRILKNISLFFRAGEKIGIIGRTGAGKSSLTVALYRLVELTEGTIEIDDVDISEISLSELRTKLSIIPQDPVLFSGTIRSNLDPFKDHTDAEIWEALGKTQLKSRVQSLTGHLDASVGFGGDNLSVGERQLLCLSRALLRNSKILLLDEATAAVDRETEVAVQNTIQREFVNCTILTIAHRLQTVTSSNRILVMDDGEVLEFDTPLILLADPSSEFSRMIAAAKRLEADE